MRFDPAPLQPLEDQMASLNLHPGEPVEFVVNGFQRWLLPQVEAYFAPGHAVVPVLVRRAK